MGKLVNKLVLPSTLTASAKLLKQLRQKQRKKQVVLPGSPRTRTGDS